MHFRFEINLIANEILGPEPRVSILRIAWRDKQKHIHQFLEDYHRQHQCLPSGSLDLGSTEGMRLSIGVVDFDTVRVRIDAELQRKVRRNLFSLHRFNFGDLFRVMHDNLSDAINRFHDSYLSLHYYWRGQWFTRAWWYYHHK